MNVDPKDPHLIRAMHLDPEIRRLSRELFDKMCRYRYSYNFSWLGRPIIQFPQDIVAIQELIWSIKPDLIVETGIAHGGSLILSASMLQLIGGSGLAVGIDVDIRAHNRSAVESHPLKDRLLMIEGSSIDPAVVARVHGLAQGKSCAFVVLDSNHTHAHVLRELELYSPLVRRGSYVVVMDTVIEDMAPDFFPDRPWGRGDNPKTAVRAFLSRNDRFEVDTDIEAKLLLTVAPGGYLKCVKD